MGFDQHPESNSAGKSHDTAHLKSQLGNSPKQCVCSMGEMSKILVWVPVYNHRMQTNIIINLQANSSSDFMLMCKTWHVVKPKAWLSSPPAGTQQSQDPSLIYNVASLAFTAGSHSQSGQCPERLEARPETYSAVSLKPKQDYLISQQWWWCWFSGKVVSDSCNPMDCGLPGSYIPGTLPERILEWIVISFSMGSSQSRNWNWVSFIAGRFFTDWASSEATSLTVGQNKKPRNKPTHMWLL